MENKDIIKEENKQEIAEEKETLQVDITLETDQAVENEENSEVVAEENAAEKEETPEEKRRREREALAKWYIVQTRGSFEKTARNNILTIAENSQLKDYIFDVKVLMEEKEVETKSGKKIKEVPKFPTYMFVKMIYTDQVWYEIVKTPGITSFVGGRGRPTPLTDEEVRIQRLEVFEVKDVDFTVGETVVVMAGALANQSGVVQEIDKKHHKVKVNISMFGREVPVELGFSEVEKI